MNKADALVLERYVDFRLKILIEDSRIENEKILEKLFAYIDNQISLDECSHKFEKRNRIDALMARSFLLKKQIKFMVNGD